MKSNTVNFRSPLIKRKRIWTFFENQMMLAFLQSKREEIESHMVENISSEKRTNKNMFFKQMSDYIKTKNDLQCKSRYQKVEGSILDLIGIDSEIVNKYLELKAKKRAKKKIQKRLYADLHTADFVSTRLQRTADTKSSNGYSELKLRLKSGESSFVKKEGWNYLKDTSFKFNKDFFLKSIASEGGFRSLPAKQLGSERTEPGDNAIFFDE